MRGYGSYGLSLGLAPAQPARVQVVQGVPFCQCGYALLAGQACGVCGCRRPATACQQPVAQAPITKVKYGTDHLGRAVKTVTKKYPDGRKKTKRHYVSRTGVVRDARGRAIQSIWYWDDGTTTKKSL